MVARAPSKMPRIAPAQDPRVVVDPALPEHPAAGLVAYRLFAPADVDRPVLLARILGLARAASASHLWHHQRFSLRITPVPPHSLTVFDGCTDVGDCIADEWLIVHLLRLITRSFPALYATVSDSDGQFLLIEAADHIPQWLSPAVAQNRVFICDGNLHIIPIPSSPSTIQLLPTAQTAVSLSRAIMLIQSHPELTRAADKIQAAAFARCEGFPDVLQKETHVARCIVPRNVARALKADPSLIGAAVHAFCERDALQMKACKDMRNFSPRSCVTTSIKFTRTMFAQITSEQFIPPAVFEVLQNNSELNNPIASETHQRILGAKLAVGFEILAAATAQIDGAGELDVDTYIFEADPKWRAFKGRLENAGFFRGEQAGSKMYQLLEREAKVQHLASFAKVKDVEDEVEFDAEYHPVVRLRQALSKIHENTSDEELLCLDPEDPDDWLYVDADSLQKILEQRGGPDLSEADLETDEESAAGESDEADESRAAQRRVERKAVRNLEKVVHRFGEFVDNKSSVDGALFPGEVDAAFDELVNSDDDSQFSDPSSDSDASDNESADMQLTDDEMTPIKIDNDKFMKSMMKILGVEESVLKPAKGKSSPAATNPRHNVPPAPPSSFDAQNILTRPKPPSSKLVTLDDSDDDDGDLSGARGVGIVGNRRGVQHEENDSDEEDQVSRKWDKAFLREIERVENELARRAAHPISVDVNGDESMKTDDEDDVDLPLDEYMAAMDLELSRKNIGRRGTGTKTVAARGESNSNAGQERPKWRLNSMKQRGVSLDDGDSDDDDNAEDDGSDEFDVDTNLVKNLLQSFQAQQGLPGPASNILGRMGLQLPRNDEASS